VAGPGGLGEGRIGYDVGMANTSDPEAEALFTLVQSRYGERLTEDQIAELREQVASLVARARPLRAVRLKNSDEPAQPFAPFRAGA
jgi:hypothetical protein